MVLKCEYCGKEVKSEIELDVEHRACRLKAAFPGAYTEEIDGLVTFDMGKVSETLGLFYDIVVGRKGQPLHPLEGSLHFRISVGWVKPEIWVEIPIQVGNRLSHWVFRITEQDWLELVKAIAVGLDNARTYLQRKDQGKAQPQKD